MASREGNKLGMVKDLFHNTHAVELIRRYQKIGRFDVWQIHNVFPGMSPAVYEEAFRLDVPIVHYLHNYRMSCVNGFFINHGEPCMRCANGNFFPAFQTACWSESRINSALFGAVLKRTHMLEVFKKVTLWISLSERQKEIHVGLGIPEDRIKVVPHFLEVGPIRLPYSRKPVAIFVGRLSVEKGVANLLQAWAQIQTPYARLLIVGDGPERETLEELTRSLKLQGVKFLGFVSRQDQEDLWKEAAVSIVPSIWEEPFGMVVLEAWAKGRPVIAHRIGALPELIADGENGFLAEPFDTSSLAQAIDRAFADPAQTEQMGLRGYQTLKAEYNQRRWIERLTTLYKDFPKK